VPATISHDKWWQAPILIQELTRNSVKNMDFRVVDKRHFADPNSIPVASLPDEKPRYPSYVEELMARVAETERRFEEKKKWLDEEITRTRARLEMDYERNLALARQGLVLPLLDVLDNLERATAAATQGGNKENLLEGLKLTIDLFKSKLQSLGVEPLAVLGEPFNPNLEQAVGVLEVDDPAKSGVVLEEVLRGYKMEDQLLRPAMVRVGR
jgi:molecular chaperone GrpE